jgi:hypothetical protein
LKGKIKLNPRFRFAELSPHPGFRYIIAMLLVVT